ncbi:MAG: hypothetical protein H6684_03290 [Deltaproteobacteria bacterium]|nr:hypothetical protein [bacterium]MCB9487738.1 hypothetical protein [Deltaproteobacteria bacterium]
MTMRKDGWLVVFLAVLAISLVSITTSCGDDDDDDEDSGTSYGEDIEGLYPVTMVIEKDDCNTDNEGHTEDWVIEIEQSGNFGSGTVSYQRSGSGTEMTELFKAQVYGSVMIKADVEQSPLSGSNCTKFDAQSYRLAVDTDEGTISGTLASDIFYLGTGCDSSNVNCSFERSINSSE